MARKIILDCDPGHDDAMAILLAHAAPEVELLAVTTVAGNQTLPKTTLNARRVMSLAGIADVPLAAGADRPLVREQVLAGDIHGESGLDGFEFDEPVVEVDPRHAVDLIIDVLRAEEQVTLVPVGPLTNIALALRKEPRITEHIEEIVLMGGGYTRGNITPFAEFNIYVDAEAASVVFHSGVPVTMVGLDLTHQAKAMPDVVERIRALDSPVARMAAELLTFFADTYRDIYGLEGPPLHDPCALVRVARPELVRCRPAHVEVETRGEWTYGATVCDIYGKERRESNALVATELDVPGFWEYFIENLAHYGGADS